MTVHEWVWIIQAIARNAAGAVATVYLCRMVCKWLGGVI